MLAELFLYLFTPASFKARRNGYVKASVDLWSLARHARQEWIEHEKQCHNIIHQGISQCSKKRTVVVLGSGLLRDVPINVLSRAFDQVMLVDVVHPLPARWKTRRLKNVFHITLDLNGNRITDLNAPSPLNFLHDSDDINLVISANILSQIALEPRQHLPRNMSDQDADLFTLNLIKGHYQDLLAFKCPVTLLTDTHMITRRNNEEIIETYDLLYGLALPVPDHKWTWHLAPRGSDDKLTNREHTVQGFINIRRHIASSR
jgi:hypothetical protein